MAAQQTYLVDGAGRRWFLKQSSVLAGLLALPPLIARTEPTPAGPLPTTTAPARPVTLTINRKTYKLTVGPRDTLLDVLRERLDLTGSKKGCDHGQCGACTVHIDGRAVNACLVLAVMQTGRAITTIEGLAPGKDELHPVQAAFLKHDGYQCGFCTPGQIMSAVTVLREGHAGSRADIREWMSGNICRCGAYGGIVDAVESVKQTGARV